MRSVSQLPAAFRCFEEIGGALEFAVFEDADGDVESAIDAIAAVVKDIDRAKLLSLGGKSISDQLFYGDWYRDEDDALVYAGTITTKDKRTLVNPTYQELDVVSVSSCGADIPKSGSCGQFAYAFCETPYGLRARPGKIQGLFHEIRDFVLPPNLKHEISDWSSPRLIEVSDYFSAGLEWWGVFLFTIYVPDLRRLTAIAGSTTD